MRATQSGLVRLYSWLLRLYPAPFRESFAEEMQTVFSLQIWEAGNWRNVMSIVLLEVACLPFNLMREHAAVQRRPLLLAYAGGSNMSRPTSLYRRSLIMSVGLAGVILLLVILPFIQHGLYQHSVPAITSGMFDPKGFAPFTGAAGETLHVFTLLIVAFMIFWSGVAGVFLTVSLLKHWRHLKTHQRFLGVMSLLITCSLVLFVFSPIGRPVFIWIMD